ncbi:zinc-dependent metalloprotease [Chitinophaga pendula]|uniref:M57 family metalloprotease n=1 Tax=Chitinophaga TaxID=79328 RepID=UPI000BAEE964|nr:MULTISPECIES: M57 family metalloprotease [Chitinophaga]ASZ10656.1 hypothetical protein CK934_06520 [Chitinophaga sp. MD30]UCJ06368.1 zinc-dependent metalloprotease [Chitinophaga pendula]
MKKLLKPIAWAIGLGMIMAACNKNADTPASNSNLQPDNAKQVLAYIHSLGFKSAVIREEGNAFIVEDDMVFPKNMKVPDNSKPRTEQYYTGDLVDDTRVSNIRLKVDASLSSMSAEIDTAIARWNRIDGCNIHWVKVSSSASSWDVYMTNKALAAPPGRVTCGRGTFPSGGEAGDSIWINKSAIANNSFEQRQRTITHEMGHNVSFTHTNAGTNDGDPVPGVGGTDSKSLMNGGQCNSGATVFSDKDKKAAKALYPSN